MKRSTIGICLSGFHPRSEATIVDQILKMSKDAGFNVLIFTSLMLKSDFPKDIDLNSNVVRGESEIFNLINYDKIDGLFVFGNSIFRTETVYELQTRCKEHNVPFINVNDPAHFMDHNITIHNSFSMALVLEHLIKVHKLTKINFIGGYPGNKESDERLNAYKKTLAKFKIPIDENRIAFGHFWRASIDCVKRFEEDGLPEAIVCANDIMAILVSDYLKTKGYRIPEDIIVTGFDGIPEAFEYQPSITTVRPKFKKAGEIAFEAMQKLIQGKNVEPELSVDAELLIQESCGCKKHNPENINFVDYKFERLPALSTFHKQLTRADVFFSNEKTIDELIEQLAIPLDIFNFKSFCFCIDYNLETKDDYWSDVKNKKYGMPSKVLATVPYYVRISEEKVFPSKDLMWYDFLDTEQPAVFCLAPMYYQNHSLGYMIYEIDAFKKEDYEIFQLWAYNTAEKIGTFYLMKELERLNVKDHLTGLYNRRGMDKYFTQVYNKIKTEKEYLSIVCIDIDYLKTINDKFGHEGGDNAIVQVAKAINKVFAKNGICVRTGGDEFCVLIHSQKIPNVDKLIEKVTALLKDYNAKSGLAYEVMCSCGYFTLSSEEFTTFEHMQKIADERLYQVKANRHNRRKSDK